jgi:hypothetical protein
LHFKYRQGVAARPHGVVPAPEESGARAPFIRMRLCLTGLLVLCSLLAAPIHAQQRSGAAIGIDPTPLDLPAFRIAPLDALFVTMPVPTWLAEWTAATRGLLASS